MTKKDYELIAKAINGSRIYSGKAVNAVADEIAWALSADNPKFDKDKFLQACGIERHSEHASGVICQYC